MRLVAVLLLLASSMAAQDDLFETKIRPLLATHCYACHGPKMQTAGFDFSTAEGFAKVDRAKFLAAIRYEGKVKMPPTAKLSPEQIADLAAWVKMGAAWSKTVAPARRHVKLWALEARNPVPPQVRNSAWAKTPIDAHIMAKLEEKGIQPAPPADKVTLLRRATFDLTGLPPTEKEIDDFLADQSPQAFGCVVDRLLASPRYGERWGRHWLDVARYADSTGADEDHRYPHAWRYRDYVIEAFNRDLPYNQFIVEQVAGDLLPPKQPGTVNARGIVATGFLSLGPRLIAEQDKPKMVYDMIDEQIDVTTRGFLGLTIACARCHDHKFDPITTKDYYSLASIFASTKAFQKVEGTVSQMYIAPLVPAEEYKRYEEYQEKVSRKKKEMDELVNGEITKYEAKLRPRLVDYMVAARNIYERSQAAPAGLDPVVLQKWVEYLRPSDDVKPHLEKWWQATAANAAQIAAEYQKRYELSAAEWEKTLERWSKKVASSLKNMMTPPDPPDRNELKDRFFIEVSSGKGPFAVEEKERKRVFPKEVNERLVTLKQEWEELKTASPPEPEMAVAVTEGTPVEQHVFIRGTVGALGDAVPKQFPVVLAGDNQSPITHGSGRLELARWLARDDHPLTARVMVNRIWQWHFGEGLVRTPSNWGTLGEPPTHPALLNSLGRWFVESGWSVKAVHRMIMLSSTYQMSSDITPQKAKTDPSNRLWSRFNRRRLDVEEIRDAMLMLDGSNDWAMGGTLQKGAGTDGENNAARLSFSPEKSTRRTVYLPLRRSNLPTLLNLFDFGDATTTGEGRARTNIAPQALFMMNSQFVAKRAKGLSERLAEQEKDEMRRVQRAYRLVLGRKPSSEETAEAWELASKLGWPSLCRVLLSSNEFIYVD